MFTSEKREMIGNSASFLSALHQVDVVAPADCAVLLHGETGTGKELFAREIHQRSRRSKGPFVTLNCAAIPSGLLESELFGHDRGAFTGAFTQTIGRFQMADRGTLFLDEIGDLPLELQPKLLRVLQEQEFERLGSSRTIRVDVRIVAATNRNLAEMVTDRCFRADLLYRLNVFPITLPSLRDRRDDIPILVRHFARQFATRMNKSIDLIPDDVMRAIQLHDWPGNIRELQNHIERAVLLSSGSILSAPILEGSRPVTSISEVPSSRRTGGTLAELERAHILEALTNTNWVIGGHRGAASQLGLPRTTLIARMRKHGIARETPAFEVHQAKRFTPWEAALSA